MLLYDVVDAFDKAKLKYVLIGGYALALHGVVRATIDVDFVLQLRMADYMLAEKTLKEIGLTSRLPISATDVITMRKEYIKNRNLKAWSFVDNSAPSRQVDILITHDMAKVSSQKMSVAGRRIAVATLEALLKMKIQAGRPQDLIDVQSIRAKLDEKK
ncbi:MAG: nucleotidyltransferase [Bdellovibrionales bacterium]|nr:nucleotidyltransferase [Bdellovibrionales bacterium]